MRPSLLISDQPVISTTQSGSSKETCLCTLCNRQYARYTCPKCNVPYCSLMCFRSEAHIQCSEAFYKEELEHEIRLQPNKSSEERKQMMELLKRFEEGALEDDLTALGDGEGRDDEDIDELGKRWEGVNLDEITSDELWAMLTTSEREAFMSKVNNPESESAKELLRTAAQQVKSEDPWWDVDDVAEAKDDSEINTADNLKTEHSQRRLPALIQIPQAMVKPPNINGPFLLYNICAIGMAYTYTNRTIRISPLSCSPLATRSRSRSEMDDARTVIESLAPFLTEKKSQLLYKTMDEVVRDMWMRIEDANPAVISLLLRDVAKIFTPKAVTVLSPDSESIKAHDSETATPSFITDLRNHPLSPVLVMLSDLFNLFKQASKSSTNHITHKLLFYSAHILSIPTPVMSSLVTALTIHSEKLRVEAATQVDTINNPNNQSPETPLTVGHSLIVQEEPERSSEGGSSEKNKIKHSTKSDLDLEQMEQMGGSGNSNVAFISSTDAESESQALSSSLRTRTVLVEEV